MARNFYYGADAKVVSGSAAFSRLINEDWAALGVAEVLAVELAATNAALQSAYQLAIDPTTRTPVAVAQKNLHMKALQYLAATIAKVVTANPAVVTDAQLVALGLQPRSKRTRRNVPDTAPVIRVGEVRGRAVNLRVSEAGSTTSRKMPFGAQCAAIYAFVGQEPPTDPSQFRLECITLKTRTQIVFPNDIPSGATVWLSARWISRRGETSVASSPMPFNLQGGPIAAETPAMRRKAA